MGSRGTEEPELGRELELALSQARALVRGAKRAVVVTGAGVSAESGVPTFRGSDGLWRSHRPEELATPGAFARDPRLVWEWYAWRRSLIAGCRPNAAHLHLAQWAIRASGRVRIITQNVDGLHAAAARQVGAGGEHRAALPLELHGSIQRTRCTGCGARMETSEHSEPVDASSFASLPRCRGCGELLRPDVVWFGEALDPAVLGAAFDAAEEADVCLIVGTSGVVYPAAAIPLAAARRGAATIEVNPEPSGVAGANHLALKGLAGALIPRLLE